MQLIRQPFNPETDYTIPENLENLSVRGLGHLLESLGSDSYTRLYKDHSNNGRELRRLLLAEVDSILKSDREFSFDEETTVDPEQKVPAGHTLDTEQKVSTSNTDQSVSSELTDFETTENSAADADSGVEASLALEKAEQEDPLNAILLDDLEDPSTDDPMDKVTAIVDSMDRSQCVDHVEKFLPSDHTYENWEDFSTPDLRSMLLEYYYAVQSGLAAADEDMEIDDLTSDEDISETEGQDQSFEDEHDDSQFEENSDSDSEYEHGVHLIHESDSYFADDEEEFDEEADFEMDADKIDYADDEQQAMMDRIESANYMEHSGIPHVEIRTEARLIIQMFANSDKDLNSVDRSELEAVQSNDGEFYDLRNPLRSVAAAQANDKNAGFFTEILESVMRVLAEFNAANRTYVGGLNVIQVTLHTILNNLNQALAGVTQLPDDCGLNLPAGFSIKDFFDIKVCLNPDTTDTAAFFDVVVHLNVPLLGSFKSVEKLEQTLKSLSLIISTITDATCEETDSHVEHSIVFAASLTDVLNSDVIRNFINENPHYKVSDLLALAEANYVDDEDNVSEPDDESFDEDESFDVDEDSNEDESFDVDEVDDSDEDYSDSVSLVNSYAQTYQGVESLTHWNSAVIVELNF